MAAFISFLSSKNVYMASTNLKFRSEAVTFWFLSVPTDRFFHAINCSNEKNCVFSNQLLPAVNNTGAYEKRFGHFLFVCEFCMTCEEERMALATIDRVDVLEKKIDSIKCAFKSEINDLKSLLTKPQVSSLNPGVNSIICDNGGSKNVWEDKVRTENLKHTMAIKNDENGNPVDAGKLEKICVENGISVHKTFTLKNSSDTGIVLNSKSDADKLKGKILSDCPEHKIEKVATKLPTINVVGFIREYSKKKLFP